MLLFIDFCLLILLSITAIQDFKHRAISWYLIPLLIIAFIFKVYNTNESNIFWFNSAFNFVFVFIQLILLTLYIGIKNKKMTNIINSYLGLGDILFFMVLCLALSPFNFVIFYIVSILFTAIGYLAYTGIVKKPNREIPLAGSMALLFIFLIFINFLKPIPFYTDNFWLAIIN